MYIELFLDPNEIEKKESEKANQPATETSLFRPASKTMVQVKKKQAKKTHEI